MLRITVFIREFDAWTLNTIAICESRSVRTNFRHLTRILVRKEMSKGASINYAYKQGGGMGFPKKCQWYCISLFSKLVNEGGRGSQKSSKFCQRSLWMPPKWKVISILNFDDP